MNKIKKCFLCDVPLKKDYIITQKFSAGKCPKCSLISVEWQRTVKNNDYYTDNMHKNYEEYYKEFRINVFNKTLKKILKYLKIKKNKPATLLDIGCSYGWFLETAEKFGIITAGIEPSEKIHSIIKKKFDVRCCSAEEYMEKNKRNFDIITLWNVLEHLKKPCRIISQIAKSQKKGAILIITVPNTNGFINKSLILSHKMSMNGIKEPIDVMFQSGSSSMHLHYFKKNHIKKILKNNNYEIIEIIDQNIINPTQLKKRFLMEKFSPLKRGFYTVSLKTAHKISEVLNMKDEMIIIARKK